MNKRGDVYDVIKMCYVGGVQERTLTNHGFMSNTTSQSTERKSSPHGKHNSV